MRDHLAAGLPGPGRSFRQFLPNKLFTAYSKRHSSHLYVPLPAAQVCIIRVLSFYLSWAHAVRVQPSPCKLHVILLHLHHAQHRCCRITLLSSDLFKHHDINPWHPFLSVLSDKRSIGLPTTALRTATARNQLMFTNLDIQLASITVDTLPEAAYRPCLFLVTTAGSEDGRISSLQLGCVSAFGCSSGSSSQLCATNCP